MNNIRVLIVDDEPLAHKVLENYCTKIDGLELVGSVYDGVSTINFLAKHSVDALLLDVQMPDLTGFELIEALQKKCPKVILTTAYTEFALDSFDYDQVVDYLHKPIRMSRFIKAIERLKRQLTLEQQFLSQSDQSVINPPASISQEFISIKENKITYKIRLSDIEYVQSWGNYLKIFLSTDEMKLVRKTIKEIEQELADTHFERIHKSYLVNAQKVMSIEGNQLRLKDALIPIGKHYALMAKAKIIGK